MSLDNSARETGRVGQYRLLQRLGEGGMGVVHLALDPSGQAVAIKVLRAHIASDPDARRRLAREVATLRRVRHPQVAAVIDADVEGEVPYLVTQFVPGKPLDTHVRDHGPLPRGHVARVGAVLAEALRALHDLGIVHRDVKPANVMLLDGDPVLIDFGIAHVTDESRITHTGLVMGTPGYLSPEIIGGEAVTAATDWWGWGATLAYAATGRPPFGTGPIEVVLDRVRRGDCDIAGVDAGLRATLTAALAVDPTRRPRPDRLVAGLAAVAPIRNGNRVPAGPSPVAELSRQEAPTERTPPPHEAITARTPPPPRETLTARTPPTPAAEALTEVVTPVASTPAALPDTRRFDHPGRPNNSQLNGFFQAGGTGQPNGTGQVNGSAQPPNYGQPNGSGQVSGSAQPSAYGQPPTPIYGQLANGFGGAARPPAGRQPPSAPRPVQPTPAPWAKPADQAPANPAPPTDPTRGVLFGVLAVFAIVAGVAPYGAVWIAAVGMVLARVIDRSTTALLQRRDLRGPRGSDSLVTTMALPWRLLTSIVTTGLALILPLLIGASVTFIAASLWAGAPADAIPGDPGPLAAGMVAVLLSSWWGPGGGSLRRGTVKGIRFACPTPRARIVVWGVLALIVISALVVMNGPSRPDWGPLNGQKLVQTLTVR